MRLRARRRQNPKAGSKCCDQTSRAQLARQDGFDQASTLLSADRPAIFVIVDDNCWQQSFRKPYYRLAARCRSRMSGCPARRCSAAWGAADAAQGRHVPPLTFLASPCRLCRLRPDLCGHADSDRTGSQPEAQRGSARSGRVHQPHGGGVRSADWRGMGTRHPRGPRQPGCGHVRVPIVQIGHLVIAQRSGAFHSRAVAQRATAARRNASAVPHCRAELCRKLDKLASRPAVVQSAAPAGAATGGAEHSAKHSLDLLSRRLLHQVHAKRGSMLVAARIRRASAARAVAVF